MKKRIVSLILAFAMVISMAPAAWAAEPEASPFTDVTQKDWFYEPVTQAVEAGLFNGTGQGKFEPDGTMTRAMYVTVLGRIAGVDPAEYAGNGGFADVESGSWYAPYVAWAAKLGVAQGYSAAAFGVEDTVTREQMAVMAVRYFEKTGITLGTDGQSGDPADIGAVSAYAVDGVRALWRAGLLKGEQGRVNPRQNATRAEGAAFCMRADDAVAAYYVSIGKPRPGAETSAETPDADTAVKPGGGHGGGSSTRYFQVTFLPGDGAEGAALPKSDVYKEGTAIGGLPMPAKEGFAFLGWYRDAGLTLRVASEETLSADITLYAGFAEAVENLAEGGAASFVTSADQPADFTVTVLSSAPEMTAEEVRQAIVFSDTNLGAETDIAVSGGAGEYTVAAAGGAFEEGATYKLELTDDRLTFVYEGVPQPQQTRIYNFTTARQAVQNLELKNGIRYLPAGEVTGLDTASLPLATVMAGSGDVRTNEDRTGSFTYTGGESIQPGDTVAVYEGTRPDERTLEDTEGDVAYVTVTAVSGDTCEYRAAESEEVLLTPDVLPVDQASDTDGDPNNGSITVAKSAMDYSGDEYAAMGLSAVTTIDEGDFVALYVGGLQNAENAAYGRVTAVQTQADTLTVRYEAATKEDVLASMDIYGSQEVSGEKLLDGTDQAALEKNIVQQAKDSGFAEQASQYLAAMAMETDGFQQIGDRFAAESYDIMAAPSTLAEGRAAAAGGAKVSLQNRKVDASVGTKLTYFNGKSGLRCDLTVSFDAVIDAGQNDIVIHVSGTFEEEVLLSINTSGGAIWKWAWIFPYIYDYRLNANIDVGNYTAIEIDAKIGTFEKGGNWNWDDKEKVQDIGRQIESLTSQKDTLAQKYTAMLQNESDWIDIFSVGLFNVSGSVDPFHILVYGISTDFVVSANMNVTVGMDFYYANAKRYNFSILLFHKESTNETIDLESERYAFTFYVMGELGIRAGIRMQIAVGLFSLDLDSVGITAEAGAYARLWGYFYYYISSGATRGDSAGAILLEVGIYLKIDFNAQLLNGKFSYSPTIYENEWPLWSVGERYSVGDFAYTAEGAPHITMIRDKTYTLPDSVFSMKRLDLQEGGFTTAPFDGAKYFKISMSNPAFSYQPGTNSITVTPVDGSVEETGRMMITWIGAPAAFTTLLERTVGLHWSDPSSGHFIKFETGGGSIVEMIFKGEGGSVQEPAAPVKQGYTFAGWFTDAACTTAYQFPKTMPAVDTTVYAKWSPNTDTPYKVEHYRQNVSGSGYTLAETDRMTGTTDGPTAAAAKTYEGFTAQPVEQTVVSPSGATVTGVFYDRRTASITFDYGAHYAEEQRQTSTLRYGATVYAPRLTVPGYTFAGWDAEPPQTMPAQNLTFTASWTPDPNTAYRAEYYIQNTAGDGYTLREMQSGSGQTDAAVDLDALKLSGDAARGLTFEKATVDGETVETAAVKGDGSLVLKLYYTRDAHTVTYLTEGKTYQTDPYRFGATITAPKEPEKQGYSFAGWYTGETFETRYTFGGAMDTGDVTLYAKFTPNLQSFKVEHYVENPNAEDGVYTLNETEAFDAYTGETLSAAAYALDYDTRYTYVKAEAETVTVPAGGGLTVKLYYDCRSYPVAWDTDGGSLVGDSTFKYGQMIAAPEPPTKEGYNFGAWVNDEAGGATIGSPMPAEAVTLRAAWLIGQFTLTFNYNNGTADQYVITDDFEAHIVPPENPTRQGYTFTGWQPECPQTMPAQSRTLVAQWQANTYGVTLDFADGTGENLTAYTYDTVTPLPTPARRGYTFRGWLPAGAGEPVFQIDKGGEAAERSYTAKWEAITYPVIYSGMAGASGGGGYPETYTTGGETFTLPALARTGYRFKGWFVGEHAVTALDPAILAYVTGTEINVTAKWETIPYTITYAGFPSGVANPSQNPTAYNVESGQITLSNPTQAEKGYRFTGWTEGDGTELQTSVIIPKGSTGNLAFTAHWEKIRYAIDYRLDGGTQNAGSPTSFTFDQRVDLSVLANEPAKQGYMFVGWYDDPSAGSRVTEIPAGTYASKTLYARWMNYGTSESNPTAIGSANELVLVRDRIQEHRNVADTLWLSAYYRLSKSFTVTGDSWDPIGQNANTEAGAAGNFVGTFDGGGNTLTFTPATAEAVSMPALFGTVGTAGTVKNLKLAGRYNSGSVLTACNFGKVQSCEFTKESVLTGEGQLQTMVGVNYGDVSDCTFAGDMLGSSATTGGLVGRNTEEAAIADCRFTGKIDQLTTASSAGGIAYQNDGAITGCTVTGSIKSGNDAGGVAALNYGAIEACTADGLTLETGSFAGDLSGAGGIVSSNFSTGSISSCTVKNATVAGAQGNFGGIAAVNEKDIKDCTVESATIEDKRPADGPTTATGCSGGIAGRSGQSDVSKPMSEVSGCSATNVTVTGLTYAGGIVALNYGLVDGSGCTVSGHVNAKQVSTDSAVGGAVGFNITGTVQNCTITTANSFVTIEIYFASTFAGGVLGRNGDSGKTGTLKNCTYTGTNPKYLCPSTYEGSVKEGCMTNGKPETTDFS